MKKQFIIPLFFCAVAMLVWVSSGFANRTWTDTSCGACHGSETDHFVHDDHPAEDVSCNDCHEGDFDNPAPPSKCIECHPGADPGECPLVIAHEDSPFYAPEGDSCLTCHAPCDEPEGCETDADCDDDLFCTGVASCSIEGSATVGVCVAGTDPCVGEICLEESDECVECVEDSDCEEDETCEGNMCNASGCPEGTPDEVLLFDKDGDCLLNKDELKAYQSSLKTVQKAQKTDLKNTQSLEKDKYKLIKTNFSTK